jgi:type I restriction enzyme R subunit
MSNFTFLETHWTDLARLGDLSEKYVYSDPNTSIIKQGMLSEVMVKYMLAYDGIEEPEYDNTHASRIRLLKKNDLLPRQIDDTLYILRKARNDAAHNATEEPERALHNLKLLYELCVWYMQIYGDYSYKPKEYVPPIHMVVDLADLEKENAELEARNKELLIELENIQKNGKADSNRRAFAYKKAGSVNLSEEQTREIVDEQLRRVGWEANTKEIRYSRGSRPTKGKNLAIAEWPTDSKKGNNGYADYALFIGEKLVGVIEAKKKHTDIPSVLDGSVRIRQNISRQSIKITS